MQLYGSRENNAHLRGPQSVEFLYIPVRPWLSDQHHNNQDGFPVLIRAGL